MTEVPQDEPRTIYELLPEVMKRVGGVAKAGETTGGGQTFRFRGIEHVLEKVHPALVELGVSIVPHRVEVLNDERYQARGGAHMRNVQVRTTFRAYGPRGDYVTLEALGEGSDAGDKATAKSLSIAHKYALFEALSIPTEDDPDREAHQRGGPPAPPPPEWLEPLVARILELPVEVQSELSAYGQRVGIGERWQGATEDGRERLHGLVERAEAKAAEAAKGEGAEEPVSEPQAAEERPDAEEGARLAELGKEPL
jgi:hypothetical protein